MDQKNSLPSAVQVGMAVEVNPQSDRTRKTLATGTVTEVLTTNSTHPHGILVLLDSGVKGRVRKVITKRDTEGAPQPVRPIDKLDEISLKALISQGENHTVEFKARALWSSKFTKEDIKNHKPQSRELYDYGQATSKIILAKAIAGFLNTYGGTLIIGVEEVKSTDNDVIIGIEPDIIMLKDSNQDGYRRMLVDLFKEYFPANIYNHLNDHVQFIFEDIDGLIVCGIAASKSDQSVFATFNKKEHFYVRTDASTRELTGSQILDYCEKHFRKS